ncbi:beta-propeller fold lactonase family protein [Mycobacteroides chelonae]|uniref:beta-propeller fold lactonase family protein n=1 Tax=Mycobacteroides chelonae TaxID=1774 RepID=UPI0013F4F206
MSTQRCAVSWVRCLPQPEQADGRDAASGRLGAFGIDESTGSLRPIGSYLYASNRGSQTVAVYGIDRGARTLTLIGFASEGVSRPTNFAIDLRWIVAATEDSATLRDTPGLVISSPRTPTGVSGPERGRVLQCWCSVLGRRRRTEL